MNKDDKEEEKKETNEIDDTKKIEEENIKLKIELEKTKAERDMYKKERDEANATILRNEPKDEGKSEFDKVFGGIV